MRTALPAILGGAPIREPPSEGTRLRPAVVVYRGAVASRRRTEDHRPMPVEPSPPDLGARGQPSIPDAAGAKRVFLSYARGDAGKVETLEDGLRSFGVDVWLDDALVGGDQWWQAILREIRSRDVFVQAVSPAGIESEACTS